LESGVELNQVAAPVNSGMGPSLGSGALQAVPPTIEAAAVMTVAKRSNGRIFNNTHQGEKRFSDVRLNSEKPYPRFTPICLLQDTRFVIIDDDFRKPQNCLVRNESFLRMPTYT